MPYALSRRPGHRSARRAFTLIEILLVVALTALGATLVVLNFDAFGDDLGEPPLRTFRQVLTEARTRAAADKTPTWIRFNPETRALIIETTDGRTLSRHPLDAAAGGAPALSLRFLSQPLSRGPEPTAWEQGLDGGDPLPRIACHPGRWVAPFTLVLVEGGKETRLPFDPFSGQPLEVLDDA